MKKEKYIHLLSLILSIAAVVFNAMPNCVLMRFMGDPDLGTYFYSYHSGFSMLPVGYAIWGGMLAGIGAGLLAVLSLIGLFRDSRQLRKWQLGTALASLASILSLLFFGSMTYISGMIAVIFASETVLLFLNRKTEG